MDVPPEEVQFKGRLRPGKMLLVDFGEGRLIEDSELKMRYATKKPYGEFLEKNSVELKERLGPEPKSDAALIEELLEEEHGSIDASDVPETQGKRPETTRNGSENDKNHEKA